MNLRKWSWGHTFGLLIGIFTIVIMIPILIFGLNKLGNNFDWGYDFYKSKLISLACIGNLPAFHLLMKKEKYDYCMGLILATFVGLFVMFYFKY